MKRILENVEIMRKNKQYAVTNGIFLKGVFPRNYNNQKQGDYTDDYSQELNDYYYRNLLAPTNPPPLPYIPPPIPPPPYG